jgi:hypothetical protein
MRQLLGGLLAAVAAWGCGPSSGTASVTSLDSSLQFGAYASSLAYPGPWLILQSDGGIQDAGPGVSIELYDTSGVTCDSPFTQLSPSTDAGTLQPAGGQYPGALVFAGFPDKGLAAGSVPLVAAAVGSGALSATLTFNQIDGSALVSMSGSVAVSAASSSRVSGTFTAVAAWSAAELAVAQANDVAAVAASPFADQTLLDDVDAGADPSVLYQDALNDARDGGLDAGGLLAALLGDPDAGGVFNVTGTFDAPACQGLW